MLFIRLNLEDLFKSSSTKKQALNSFKQMKPVFKGYPKCFYDGVMEDNRSEFVKFNIQNLKCRSTRQREISYLIDSE